ncbi:hypothetical protein ABT075_34480 [Streptomyces sp. NPDC002677]
MTAARYIDPRYIDPRYTAVQYTVRCTVSQYPDARRAVRARRIR